MPAIPNTRSRLLAILASLALGGCEYLKVPADIDSSDGEFRIIIFNAQTFPPGYPAGNYRLQNIAGDPIFDRNLDGQEPYETKVPASVLDGRVTVSVLEDGELVQREILAHPPRDDFQITWQNRAREFQIVPGLPTFGGRPVRPNSSTTGRSRTEDGSFGE